MQSRPQGVDAPAGGGRAASVGTRRQLRPGAQKGKRRPCHTQRTATRTSWHFLPSPCCRGREARPAPGSGADAGARGSGRAPRTRGCSWVWAPGPRLPLPVPAPSGCAGPWVLGSPQFTDTWGAKDSCWVGTLGCGHALLVLAASSLALGPTGPDRAGGRGSRGAWLPSSDVHICDTWVAGERVEPLRPRGAEGRAGDEKVLEGTAPSRLQGAWRPSPACPSPAPWAPFRSCSSSGHCYLTARPQVQPQ